MNRFLNAISSLSDTLSSIRAAAANLVRNIGSSTIRVASQLVEQATQIYQRAIQKVGLVPRDVPHSNNIIVSTDNPRGHSRQIPREAFTWAGYSYVPNSYRRILLDTVNGPGATLAESQLHHCVSYVILKQNFDSSSPLKDITNIRVEIIDYVNISRIASMINNSLAERGYQAQSIISGLYQAKHTDTVTTAESGDNIPIIVNTYNFPAYNIWPLELIHDIESQITSYISQHHGSKISISYRNQIRHIDSGQNTVTNASPSGVSNVSFTPSNISQQLNTLRSREIDMTPDTKWHFVNLCSIIFSFLPYAGNRGNRYFKIPSNVVGKNIYNPTNSDSLCLLYCLKQWMFSRDQRNGTDLRSFENEMRSMNLNNMNSEYRNHLRKFVKESEMIGFLRSRFSEWKQYIEKNSFEVSELPIIELCFKIRIVVYGRSMFISNSAVKGNDRYSISSAYREYTPSIHEKDYPLVPLWLIKTDEHDPSFFSTSKSASKVITEVVRTYNITSPTGQIVSLTQDQAIALKIINPTPSQFETMKSELLNARQTSDVISWMKSHQLPEIHSHYVLITDLNNTSAQIYGDKSHSHTTCPRCFSNFGPSTVNGVSKSAQSRLSEHKLTCDLKPSSEIQQIIDGHHHHSTITFNEVVPHPRAETATEYHDFIIVGDFECYLQNIDTIRHDFDNSALVDHHKPAIFSQSIINLNDPTKTIPFSIVDNEHIDSPNPTKSLINQGIRFAQDFSFKYNLARGLKKEAQIKALNNAKSKPERDYISDQSIQPSDLEIENTKVYPITWCSNGKAYSSWEVDRSNNITLTNEIPVSDLSPELIAELESGRDDTQYAFLQARYNAEYPKFSASIFDSHYHTFLEPTLQRLIPDYQTLKTTSYDNDFQSFDPIITQKVTYIWDNRSNDRKNTKGKHSPHFRLNWPDVTEFLLKYINELLQEQRAQNPRNEQLLSDTNEVINSLLLIKEQIKTFASRYGCTVCHKFGGKFLHTDHNHNTGLIRDVLCSSCNSRRRKTSNIPTYFHNGSGYDFKIINSNLESSSHDHHGSVNPKTSNYNIIAKSSENYQVFSIDGLTFYDSMKQIPGGLAALVQNKIKMMKKNKHQYSDAFPYTFNGIRNKYSSFKSLSQQEFETLIHSKAKFPYLWYSDSSKNDLTDFPSIDSFRLHNTSTCSKNHSSINTNHCTDPTCSKSVDLCSEIDYENAKNVYHLILQSFPEEHRNFGKYAVFYCELDCLLLADVLVPVIKGYRESYNVDMCYHSSAAGVAYDCMRRNVAMKFQEIRKSDRYKQYNHTLDHPITPEVFQTRMTRANQQRNQFDPELTELQYHLTDHLIVRERLIKGFEKKLRPLFNDKSSPWKCWAWDADFAIPLRPQLQNVLDSTGKLNPSLLWNWYLNLRTEWFKIYGSPYEDINLDFMEDINPIREKPLFDVFPIERYLPNLMMIPQGIEMHEFSTRMIYGGYSGPGEKRHAKKSSNSTIHFLDETSQYPSSMIKMMPFGMFEWVPSEELSTDDFTNTLRNQTPYSFIQYACEVTIKVPKKLHDKWIGYPLLLSHMHTNPMISVFGQENLAHNKQSHIYLDKNHAPHFKTPPKLVAHFQTVTQPMVGFAIAQLMHLGCKVTAIHKAMQYVCLPYLRDFIQHAFNERKKVKNTPLGDVFKLILNSTYGKFIERIDLRSKSTVIQTSKALHRSIANFRFKRLIVVNDSKAIAEHYSSSIKVDRSFIVGATILAGAKWMMYDLVENCLRKAFGDHFIVLATDTDSILFQIEYPDQVVDECFWLERLKDANVLHYLDLSKIKDFYTNIMNPHNYPVVIESDQDDKDKYVEKSPIIRNIVTDECINRILDICQENSAVSGLGTFGCEISAPITELVALRAKVYFIETLFDNKSTHKGIAKSYIKQFDKHKYLNKLHVNSSENSIIMTGFRSKCLDINTVRMRKKCLPVWNDKMYLLLDGITQVPFGYRGSKYKYLLDQEQQLCSNGKLLSYEIATLSYNVSSKKLAMGTKVHQIPLTYYGPEYMLSHRSVSEKIKISKKQKVKIPTEMKDFCTLKETNNTPPNGPLTLNILSTATPTPTVRLNILPTATPVRLNILPSPKITLNIIPSSSATK